MTEGIFKTAQRGEPGALEALLLPHGEKLFAYLFRLTGNREESLDLVQEIWVDAIRGLPKLKDESALKSWLYRIAWNKAMDGRKRKILFQKSAGNFNPVMKIEFAPDGGEGDRAAALRSAIDELGAEHRSAILLYYMEDMSYEEIANSQSCSLGTVRSRIHYAKEKLREKLNGMFAFE